MTKPRINIHIPTDLYAQLCAEARRPGVTKTAILEVALRNYFSPTASLAMEDQVIDRLEQFDVRQGAIERDTRMCLEALCQYVLYWLTRIEPIPEGERDAAQALGRRRFDKFIEQVAARLANPDED